MKCHVVPCAVVLSLLAFAPSSFAADWVHEPAPRRFAASSPSQAAARYVAEGADRLRLSGVEFSTPTELLVLGGHTVRLRQTYHGLPVFGRVVAVRVQQGGIVRTAMIDVARDLQVSPQPSMDDAAAIRIAADATRGSMREHARATLGVLPNTDRGGMLVWQVDLPAPGGMRRAMVDAHDGTIFSNLSLARDVLGRVYDINQEKTPEPKDRELANLTVTTPQRLAGRAGAVHNFVSGDIESDLDSLELEQVVEPNEGEDFLFDPPAYEPNFEDPFAQVHLYYQINRMDEYFRDTFDVPVNYDLMVVANYSPYQQTYDNAFFTPWWGQYENAIFLGQGSTDFAYDSDVVLHEFTHYVNYNAIGYSNGPVDFDQYGFVTMPGAIDEGTSDYFSSTVNDDPVVGEAALYGYARNLDDPAARCPTDLIQESHEDGRIIGSTSWSLRKALGAEIADQLVWASLTMLPGSSAMGDFGDGVRKTAEDLQTQGLLDATQLLAIASILQQAGLDDCKRILDLSPDNPRSVNMLGLDYAGQIWFGADCQSLRDYPLSLGASFIFKFEPKPETSSARFAVTLQGWDGWDLDWSLYVRRDQPVSFRQTSQDVPVVDKFDYALQGITAESGQLTIDETSSPPFDPTATYYLALGHQNCATTSVMLTVASDAPPIPDAGADGPPDTGLILVDSAGVDAPSVQPDAGSAAQAALGLEDYEPGGGCACRQGGAQSRNADWQWLGAGVAGLAGLFAALRIRRRRC